MQKFFIATYHFFKKHKVLMWVTMTVSFVIFVALASQLKYEEDITKLLPETEKSKSSRLAFGQMSIKDKIFIQIERQNDSTTPEEMAMLCDELIDSIVAPDSCGGLIKHILYRIEDDWMVNGLDYALEHFPSLLPESVYAGFDSLLTPATLSETMKQNAATLEEDPEGTLSNVLPYDPANLRESMKGALPQRSMMNTKTIERHFFSTDSTVVIAYLTPNIGSFDSKGCAKIVKRLDKCVKEFNAAHPEAQAVFHGASVLSAGNSNRIKKDIVITVAISLLIVLVVLLLCYRTPSTIAMIVVPLLYGTAMAMACVFLIKGRMSIMALGLAAPILGIAMSYILHVLTHYKYVIDPIEVLREQATPVVLSCLTTIGAFAGLLFTTSELLKDFGIFASIALVGTTLFALIFMPQFFNETKQNHSRKAFALLDKLNTFAPDRKPWLVGAIALLSVVCIVISVNPKTKVHFDNNLQNIGYRSDMVRHSETIYKEVINHGYNVKYYAAESSSFDTALAMNKAMLPKVDSLYEAGAIVQYNDIARMVLTNEEQQANIDRWKDYWNEERVAQTRRDVGKAATAEGLDPEMFDPFFTLVEADYEPDPIAESGIVPDELACNFMERIPLSDQQDSAKYLVFTSVLTDDSNTYKVADVLTAQPGVIVADPFYYTGDMVNIVHKDFNIILLISSIFVIVVLLIYYRSILMALLAFLPMFLSWYIVQGIMSIFHIDFNLINIVLSSFIFGVGVDYSIFISNGLISAVRGNDNTILSYHKTAITFSAFILVVVLGSLLLAAHPTLHSVGLCALIGMVSTISISYCLQPYLFRQLMKIPFFKKKIVKTK